MPSVCVIGPAMARLIDSGARTCVATLLCRQCTSAVPAALVESLKGEAGLHVEASPRTPGAEADYLFELIGRQRLHEMGRQRPPEMGAERESHGGGSPQQAASGSPAA